MISDIFPGLKPRSQGIRQSGADSDGEVSNRPEMGKGTLDPPDVRAGTSGASGFGMRGERRGVIGCRRSNDFSHVIVSHKPL